MVIFLILLCILTILYILLNSILKKDMQITEDRLRNFYNSLDLGDSKEEVDNLMGSKGEWVCTHYEPWLSKNAIMFQTFYWHTDFILICVFRDGKLVRKKVKDSKNLIDIVY